MQVTYHPERKRGIEVQMQDASWLMMRSISLGNSPAQPFQRSHTRATGAPAPMQIGFGARLSVLF